MTLGLGEIILIVLILSLIFGVGWIFGLAGWVRKGIRGIRKEFDTGEESSAKGDSQSAGKPSK